MTITIKALVDAGTDAETLSEVVNGDANRPNPGKPDGTVTNRKGGVIKTLMRMLTDIVASPPAGWLQAFATNPYLRGPIGQPGANVMSVGTFIEVNGSVIPASTNRIKVADRGGAEFVDVTGATLAAGGEGKWWFRTNNGTRLWRLDRSDTRSIAYGAKGDRATDDFDTLQAALDDLATGEQYPRKLKLTPGNYQRSKTLKFGQFAAIEGDGISTILNSQGSSFDQPILSNADAYGQYGLRLRYLNLYGGSHGVKIDANSENADLSFTDVSFALQRVANIEINKLAQLVYFYGGVLDGSGYGFRSNEYTTNVFVSFGQQYNNHSVSAVRMRTTQGVAFYGPRIESRGGPITPIRVAGTVAAGSKLLTVSDPVAQQARGRSIVIQGAGFQGDSFQTMVDSISADGRTITLYDAAISTVNGAVTDIDRTFGATLDFEDVNGPLLISGAYIENGQQYVMRLRRGLTVCFDSCHFTGQKATVPQNQDFAAFEWNVDNSFVTIRNSHSYKWMGTPKHVRLEGENARIYPSKAHYWGNDWQGGCGLKSFRPPQVFNMFQFNREVLDGGPANVAQLMATLKLNYVGYNSNGTALRRLVAYYDVRALSLATGDMLIEIVEQAGRRFDQLQGGTIVIGSGSSGTNGALAATFSFDPAVEASCEFSASLEWGPNVETVPSDRIFVRAL